MRPVKFKNEIIPGYWMNDFSEVYSESRPNVALKPHPDAQGRPSIVFRCDGKQREIRLDYLVISTFNRYRDDMIRVIHLDDNDWNCDNDNLIIVTMHDIIEKYRKMYNVDNLYEIDEEWKIYPDIPSIEISNFGNLRYTKTKEAVASYDSHGYRMIFINNTHYMVHRLVAEMFVENPNPEKYHFVNHLDGIKDHNQFYNLEWCNLSINAEHAMLTGLSKKRYNKDQIRNVCELLTQGVPQFTISTITGVSRKHISDIYRGRRWKSISSEYEFQRKIPLHELYNEEAMLALMDAGYKPKEIASLLKINYNSSFVSYYERLKRGLRYA